MLNDYVSDADDDDDDDDSRPTKKPVCHTFLCALRTVTATRETNVESVCE